MWHRVSFSIISEYHIRELRKYFKVYEIDERAFPQIIPYCKPITLVHPYFYPVQKYGSRFERIRTRFKALIGVDVADSDHITNLAVSMTNYADGIIVPSSYARDAYVRSGVTVPVYVVPHGVSEVYFKEEKNRKHFKELWNLKESRNLKYLLFFLWHSSYRKGADLVLKTYKEIRKKRRDVVLITKTMTPTGEYQEIIKKVGGIIVHGWLKEEQLISLYDLCDIYLLFSRGGGFELNGLEALVRGEVVVAPNRGSWTDYLPDFCLVESHNCPFVFVDNPIHDGKGVEIDVKKAVKGILTIIDDLDYYKKRVRDYVDSRIRKEFTWEAVGKRLVSIIKKYM